jgi:hypothetical protein
MNTGYLYVIDRRTIVGRDAMDNKVISHTESDEKILTFDVPDDALERAASAEEKAFTAVYCTRALYFDCGWPTVENG